MCILLEDGTPRQTCLPPYQMALSVAARGEIVRDGPGIPSAAVSPQRSSWRTLGGVCREGLCQWRILAALFEQGVAAAQPGETTEIAVNRP